MSEALNKILEVLNEEALAKAEAKNAQLRRDMESDVASAERRMQEAQAAAILANEKRADMKARLIEVANELDEYSTKLRAAVHGLK